MNSLRLAPFALNEVMLLPRRIRRGRHPPRSYLHQRLGGLPGALGADENRGLPLRKHSSRQLTRRGRKTVLLQD